jgi:hypothetical protein
MTKNIEEYLSNRIDNFKEILERKIQELSNSKESIDGEKLYQKILEIKKMGYANSDQYNRDLKINKTIDPNNNQDYLIVDIDLLIANISDEQIKTINSFLKYEIIKNNIK